MTSNKTRSRSKLSFYLSILLFTFFAAALFVFSANTTYADSTLTWDNGGSDTGWETANNWSPNKSPTSGSKVVFNSTTVANATVSSTLTVDKLEMKSGYTGTITQSGASLTATSTTITGGTFDANMNSTTIKGLLKINGSGATYLAGNKDQYLEGGLEISAGTFKQESAEINTASSLGSNYDNLEVTGGGEFIGSESYEHIQIRDLIVNSGGVVTSTEGYFYIDRDMDLTGGTFNLRDSGIVNFWRDGSGSGNYLTSTLKTDGNKLNNLSIDINIAENAVLKLKDKVEIEGKLNPDGKLITQGNNITIGGHWNNNDINYTFKPGNGTVIFDGSGQQNIYSKGENFNEVKIDRSSSSDTTILQDKLNVSSTLTVTNGTFDVNDNTSTIENLTKLNGSGATYLAGNKSQYLKGGLEIKSGTFDQGNEDVYFDDNDSSNNNAGDWVQTGGEFIGSSNAAVTDIANFDVSGGVVTSSALHLEINKDITISSSAVFNPNSGRIDIRNNEDGATSTIQNLNNQSLNAIRLWGGGLVLKDDMNVSSTFDLYGGTFDANNNTTTVTGTTKLDDSDATYLAGNKPQYLEGGLEISAGTFKQESAYIGTNGKGGTDYSNLEVTGGEFIGSSNGVSIDILDGIFSGGTIISTNGNMFIGGDLDLTGSTFDNNGGRVAFINAVPTSTVTTSGKVFHNFTLNAGSLELNDNLDVNSKLDLSSSGAFNAHSNDIKVEGNIDLTGLSYANFGSGILTLDGSGTQQLTSDGNSFGKTEINQQNSSDVVEAQDNLTVSGTLEVATGTFDANNNTTTYNSKVTLNTSTASYKAGNKPQNFNSGLTLQAGTYNGETASTSISGDSLTFSGGTMTSTNSTTLSISNEARVETYSKGQANDLFAPNILTADTGTPASTATTTFNYTSFIETDDNNSRAQFPSGTKLATADGSTQDFTNLMGSSQISSTPSNLNVKGGMQVGLPGHSLTTDQAATAQIFVGASENGNTLSIFKKVGTNDWQDTGKDCTVNGGICKFTTQSFSQFAAATEDTSNNNNNNNNNTTDDGDDGGGGGSSFGASGSTGPTVQGSNSAVLINNGDSNTNNRNVTLTFNVSNADKVAVSNSNNFNGASFNSYPANDEMNYTLPAGQGTKTVYARFSGNGKTMDSKDSIKLTTSAGTSSDSDTSTQCPLTKQQPFTTNQTQAVYYITDDCTKRAFTKPRVYFTYFDSWQDVNQTDPSTLNQINDDKLGFMPWGPNKNIKAGQLFKSVTDPKVYVQQANGNKCWIENEQVFQALNYSFNNVWDVHSSYINQTPTCGSSIDYTDHHPNYTLIKYQNSNDVYLLEPNNGQQVKRLIEDMNVFNELNLSRKDIITIDQSEQYPTGNPLTMNSSL